MDENEYPDHTQKCLNFKNYLASEFNIPDFGNFLCAYKFSLADIDALRSAASQNAAAPTTLRVYYGCDEDGSNHQLFLAVLDAEDNVLQAQPLQENETESSPASDMLKIVAPKTTPKCPPGCKSDSILLSVVS